MESVTVHPKTKVRAPLLALLIILVLAVGAVAGSTLLTSSQSNTVLNQTLSEPLNGATAAKIDISRYSGDLTVDSLTGGGQGLASGDLPYLENQELTRSVNTSSGTAELSLKTSAKKSGFRLPWVGCSDDTRWQIHLNPAVPSDIRVSSGGGEVKLNLTGMAISRVAAETGGGNVDVVLPTSAANLSAAAKTGAGSVTIEIGSSLTGSSTVSASTGAGNVVIRLPLSLAARIHTTSGMGQTVIDSRFSKINDTTYQSTTYDSAADKVEITASSGAGNVTIEIY